MEESQTPPIAPSTSTGIDIHLSYIRRDLAEMKLQNARDLGEIKTKIKELAEGTPTRHEFTELDKRVGTTEADVGTLKYYKGYLTGIVAVCSLVGSIIITLVLKYIFHL